MSLNAIAQNRFLVCFVRNILFVHNYNLSTRIKVLLSMMHLETKENIILLWVTKYHIFHREVVHMSFSQNKMETIKRDTCKLSNYNTSGSLWRKINLWQVPKGIYGKTSHHLSTVFCNAVNLRKQSCRVLKLMNIFHLLNFLFFFFAILRHNLKSNNFSFCSYTLYSATKLFSCNV